MPSNSNPTMHPTLYPRSRTRQALRLIGYNALTAAVLLILVELGLRLVGFQFVLEPPRIEFGWPSPADLEHYFISDPDLLWVTPEYPAQVTTAQGQQPAIAFMGDSVTYTGRYGARIQSIIAARHPGNNFTYINLAVAGWSTYSGLQQLQRDVLPIRPRAIVIQYGWNDHWNYFGLQDKDAARFLAPPQVALSQMRTAQLVNKALLARQQRSAAPDQARVPPDDFRSNLRQMIHIARDNDIIPILLTAPTSHQIGQEPPYLADRWLTNLEDLVPLHQQYVQVVREVAAAENAPLIDLYQEFNQLPRPDLDRLFKSDGIHPTSAGYQMIAELIDRQLTQAGLYPQIIGISGENQ